MKVLLACEESQRVCAEFRALGHEAYSCDILDCSGGHPEWHIKGDVLPLLNPKRYCTKEGKIYDGYIFETQDGNTHRISGKWDMIIAFPPCTHLAVSGARHFEKKRADGRQKEAIMFFGEILNADCDKICVENPVNIISGSYILDWFYDIAKYYDLPKEPTQYIQPYYFGDSARKKTGLWLKNLNPLVPTNIVEPKLKSYICSDGRKVTFSEDYGTLGGNTKDRGKIRSKTYPGVAKAMAEQWGK